MSSYCLITALSVTMHAMLKVCIAFCAVCLVLASVTIVLVLTRQTQSKETDYNQQIIESIIKNVQLPNGSYTVDRSNLKEASNKLAPIDANNSVLQSLGITADPTNDVLVSNCKTYLFVILPSLGTTARQKQDTNAIAGIGIQFGSSTFLHVYPLSLSSTGQGFLKSSTLKDDSELYQKPIAAPNSICPAEDKQVKLMNGDKEVQPGATVYIDEDANMPSLVASYCKSDVSASVSWSFKLTKSSTGKDNVCNNDIMLSSNSKTWSISTEIIRLNRVMGGMGNLKWTLEDQSSGSLAFKILGQQPNRNIVLEYINSKSSLWYAQYVATHESTQLSTIGPTQFDIKVVGYPLRASDNGYGVMQLTNPSPTCNQIWSWKLNCDEGIRRLNNAANQAVIWMNEQRKQAKNEVGTDVPVPTVNEGNCVFKENTLRTINDAVALKIYNGANKHYCAWANGSKRWMFVPANAQGINYVNRVCKVVPK